jgi:hypothetical protein
MTSPTVSAVPLPDNGAVGDQVDSARTLSDFGLIAVNNGSTDGSAAILNRLRE